MPTRPVAYLRRCAASAVGWILIGIGVSLLITSGWGAAPYDVFTSGLANTLHIGIGTASWICAAVAVCASWLLGTRPGWGTIASAFVVGWVINTTIPLSSQLVDQAGTAATLAVAVGGLTVLLLGAALTVSGNLGAGAIELLMLALAGSRHILNGTLGITRARWLLEAALCLTGWLLGGAVGIFTLIAVLVSGPILNTAIGTFDRLLGTNRHTDGEGDLAAR